MSSGNSRPVWVLDCSQVDTPARFWEAYLTQILVEGGEYFGRNLDALRDALSAGGPGWPGRVRIEIHAAERLAAYDGGSFIRALEAIGEDLAAQDAGAWLAVVRRSPRPSGRLYQHERLRSRELADTTVERAARWQPRPDTCQILWVKPRNRYWQRFFLDAGLAFWEEWSDSVIENEFDELRDEIISVDGLRDQRIVVVQFDARGGGAAEIRFELESGASLRIFPVDASDLDSDSHLEIRAPGHQKARRKDGPGGSLG
ncbi:MAG: barstar family protein [Deltaproteobacteria bacterium]|nr:barstar family protein [Deltaproteobacteria bacterium]